MNPSVNAKRKKEYKKDKKIDRKIENSQIQSDIQDNYDFGEDFWTSTNPPLNKEKQDKEEDLKDVNAFEF